MTRFPKCPRCEERLEPTVLWIGRGPFYRKKICFTCHGELMRFDVVLAEAEAREDAILQELAGVNPAPQPRLKKIREEGQ